MDSINVSIPCDVKEQGEEFIASCSYFPIEVRSKDKTTILEDLKRAISFHLLLTV
jgi:hypothetical protein